MESVLARNETTSPASDETLPRRLGRYELVQKLGGGMSEVYRARIGDAIGPERPLVVKIAAQSVSDDPRASARFLDEAKLALALSHGNISAAFEFGKADGRYFIVMEYVRGASVRQLIEAARREGRPFPLGCALSIAVEVARALQYAHTFAHPELGAMPLVHRDVNPSNVLVSRDGQVKLTDFGIAHALGRDPSHGVVWGQAHYVAPELLGGGAAGPASDLFALGAVLFHVLTLEPPFGRDTEAATLAAIRAGAVPSARAHRPELPAQVDEILAALLAPEVKARPATAGDARRALEQLRDEATAERGPADIASFVQELLGPEVATSGPSGVQGTNEPTVPLVTADRPAAVAASPTTQPGAPVPAMPVGPQPRRSRTTAGALVMLVVGIAALGGAWALRSPAPPPKRPAPRERTAPASVVETKRAPVETARVTPTQATPAAVQGRDPIRATTAPNGRTKRSVAPSPDGGAGAQTAPVEAPPPSREPAVVTLNSWPWSIATVDGQRLPGHTPLRNVQLTPGGHTFLFVNPELRMRRLVTVQLTAGERRVVSAVLEPEDSASPPPRPESGRNSEEAPPPPTPPTP